jgi:cytochrome oxidase Cu insertion factor (SCO1/SenC/PrrC family)
MGTLLGIASFLIAGGTAARWWRGLQTVSLPRDRTRFFMAFGLALACGVAAWFHAPGWLAGSAAVVGILLGGMFLGLGALSGQEEKAPAVTVGGAMLEFSAPADSGETFSSTTLAGKPYLLKFFRGHW